MKINRANYDKLNDAITDTLEKYGDVSQHYKEKNLTFRRFCFDLYHTSKFKIGDGIGIIGGINISDCNDDHIYTALKKIVVAKGIKSW